MLSGSPPLLFTVAGSLMLGFVYSADLPLLRWKRSPVLAAGCILVVRAFAVQFGFFAHVTTRLLNRELMLSAPLLFVSAFMCIFSVVIALFKDIPDIEGDRRASINTLSVRLGVCAQLQSLFILFSAADAYVPNADRSERC